MLRVRVTISIRMYDWNTELKLNIGIGNHYGILRLIEIRMMLNA